MLSDQQNIIEQCRILKLNIPQNVEKFTYELYDKRRKMVRLLERKGIKDKKVLLSMMLIPRHMFVPSDLIKHSYSDTPLPIGFDQTISQPFVTAFMLENLELSGKEKILEIGTGSGYMTALLSVLSSEVITVEIHEELSQLAQNRLELLGVKNVRFVVGDGSEGFVEEAPYDRICVSASAKKIPPPFIQQLKTGGIVIMPLSQNNEQHLCKIIKARENEIEIVKLCPCRFVELKGKYGQNF